MNEFLSGSLFVCGLVVSLFFLRFWRDVGDKFFLLFSLAFFLLGIERVALMNVSDESKFIVYFIRLGAFALILSAIIFKNRRSAKEES